MMKRPLRINKFSQRSIVFGCVLALVVGLEKESPAQLFGNRSVGAAAGSQMRSPLRPNGARTAPGSGSAAVGGIGAGLLDGNERFVRGNRARQEFVGTGRGELSGFVGMGQAIGVGRVPAATDSFRLEATNATRINKPLPKQPTKGMYYPRLELDLQTREFVAATLPQTGGAPSPELISRVATVAGENVEVILAGGTAILRGTVDSTRTAELTANILSFEPGIDRVVNQLSVQSR